VNSFLQLQLPKIFEIVQSSKMEVTEKTSVDHVDNVEQLSDSEKADHPSNYNAMRIDGDGEDHLHEPPVCYNHHPV
jgi:hypothetical protein